jgi:protein-S-isoprenylcysteine O-methyltransferase Ste14
LIVFLVAFVLPGLDYRFGWSQVPAWLEILAFILTFGGYALIIWVLRENSYASRIIEVTEGQKVITGGPYRLVRHPMYLGATVFYVFSPLALGSYVAMIPALLIIPVLAARILNEEKMLRQELPGYPEYTQQTRYRYFPGLW